MNPQLLIAEAKVIYLNKTRIQKKQCSIYISIILEVCQLFTPTFLFRPESSKEADRRLD